MKILLGRREKPWADGGVGMRIIHDNAQLIGAEVQMGPQVTQIINCKACQKEIELTIREDAITGEIWLEGPGQCECGHMFEVEGPNKMMSQEEIRNLFG